MRSTKNHGKVLTSVQRNQLTFMMESLIDAQNSYDIMLSTCAELERSYKDNPRSVKNTVAKIRNMLDGRAFNYVNKQSKELIRKVKRSLKADDKLRLRYEHHIDFNSQQENPHEY